jgi:hypothetical protein
MVFKKPGSGNHRRDEESLLYKAQESQSEVVDWWEEKEINHQGREHSGKNRGAKTADRKREQHRGKEKKEWRLPPQGFEKNRSTGRKSDGYGRQQIILSPERDSRIRAHIIILKKTHGNSGCWGATNFPKQGEVERAYTYYDAARKEKFLPW